MDGYNIIWALMRRNMARTAVTRIAVAVRGAWKACQAVPEQIRPANRIKIDVRNRFKLFSLHPRDVPHARFP